MEQAMREEFEDRFPVPEGIEWRPGDYFPIHTENVHEYIGRCGRASRYADMWAAWKASRAALRVELPEQRIGALSVDGQPRYVDGWNDYRDRVTEALQQAGIEVAK
ncbi:TPA: hypothetical protein SLU31_002211 [Pseudomonas aeruginosa]|nr:hypothetical protein [Pseudomonas aeruginosa]